VLLKENFINLHFGALVSVTFVVWSLNTCTKFGLLRLFFLELRQSIMMQTDRHTERQWDQSVMRPCYTFGTGVTVDVITLYWYWYALWNEILYAEKGWPWLWKCHWWI